MLSRRDLVGKLAAGAAGAVVLAATGKRASATVATSARQTERNDSAIGELPPAAEAAPVRAPQAAIPAPDLPAAPPPWELLRPLTLGAVVAHGWRLTDLSGPADGACVLTLQNERGRVQRVHVCRNDGQPHGFVYTNRFDLVVMNGGQGDLGTEENLAQAVAALSHVLAANEDCVDPAVVAALLPHSERLQQFADASEWTLR